MMENGKSKSQRCRTYLEEVSDTASKAGEPKQIEMLLAMQTMMREMAQHRAEMEAQRNENSGHQTEVTPFSAQPETSSKATSISMTDKLAKFKKFAPIPFKEAQNPNEAEEWLEEL